jgi:hypothetical protein
LRVGARSALRRWRRAFSLTVLNQPTTPQQPNNSVMLVGLGGNNGTTLMGGILANKQLRLCF